ncbi:hypothetical protein ZIOFF_061452 [Zingiber officinale]|uniref:Uncharacterized protein n=1 Tax=Zingiber officinale TaxID=94328 RepID=A0A8J5F032_ZINOF|nr:hypothetical protein ZIOFF_061452 [Zingiber officinale]
MKTDLDLGQKKLLLRTAACTYATRWKGKLASRLGTTTPPPACTCAYGYEKEDSRRSRLTSSRITVDERIDDLVSKLHSVLPGQGRIRSRGRVSKYRTSYIY